MVRPPSNAANDGSAPVDAKGQAAILLVESLIHGLIERRVISVQTAVEIVDTAAEVMAELGVEVHESPEAMAKSRAVLESISSSLRRDMTADD